MNLLIWVCLALVTWPSGFALYYTGIKEVFHPPTKNNRNNSYFGYSITYDAQHKKLVISAPRISDIGEVYDCNIENRTCAKISRDIIKRDEGKDGNKTYTHDFWFGATVKAGPDFVMMCAPRYTEFAIRFGAYVTQGRCYSRADNKLTKRKIITEKERLADSPSPIEATMDSFGWSIDVASDDKIIVGGPGMFRGRAMIYDQLNVAPKLMQRSSNSPEFNFGYAVASGTFLKDDLSYAVGSIYDSGEVAFYKRLTYVRKLEKKEDTELIGSMFGAVLCAARLVGKRTDLLVGAPTYAPKNTKISYNRGAVYVYLALRLAKMPEFHRKIVGPASGSMFGSAIVTMGDLNGDGRDEIAIGAPFEKDGRGVVYIYSGADLISELAERDLKWLQRIEPESSYGESFGMSLTPVIDYDKKACKDLAIGSPYKDTVVLFRCMAAVVVTTSAIFPKLQNRTKSGKSEFEFVVCLKVTYPRLPKLITANISTTVEMNHGYAKLIDTDAKGRISFTTLLDDKQSEYCNEVPFKLPLNGIYDTEIRYSISSELQDDPRNLKNFETSRVILSDRSVLTIQDTLWVADCAGNKTCVPKLELTYNISFHDDANPYIIGSSNKETIDISMYNDGEVAYDPCVRMHIAGTNVLKPGRCVYESLTDGDRLIKCEPSKPLWNNNSWTTDQIELEMNHLTNQDKSINITMVLYNHCNDINTVTKNKTITIPVIADYRGIIAKGETDIGNIINMTEDDINDGKNINHVYTITNNGPTNWVGLPVRVTLQKQPFIKYQNVDNAPVTVFFSATNVYLACPLIQDSTSLIYSCLVESLMAKVEFAKIIIPMSIVPKTLEGILDKDNNVTIMSSIKLEFTENEYGTESIISTIVLQEAEVPIVTIIIAVVVGLFILIIIALILYRIGFLQRKKREDLERLRKSVRRQTILRRSTMPSQSSDRRQILQGMNEEDEHDHPHTT